MYINDEDFRGKAVGLPAVEGLASYAQERLKQRERTKRLLIVAVCVLFVIGAGAMIFAPPGREHIGNFLGSVLILLALGAIGASKFILKTPVLTVDTKNQTHKAS